MKNKLFFAGILSMVLVFGFVFVGCGNGTTDNGGGGSGGGGSGLTVTGLSAFNGKVVGASCISKTDIKFSSEEINGNSVVLSARNEETGEKPYPAYTGSEILTITVSVYESGKDGALIKEKENNSVQFTNGSATISW